MVSLWRAHGRQVRALCLGERAKLSRSLSLSRPGMFWETRGRDCVCVGDERLHKDACTTLICRVNKWERQERGGMARRSRLSHGGKAHAIRSPYLYLAPWGRRGRI